MALTLAQHIAVLETRRDSITAKLAAIEADDEFAIAGSLPDASQGALNVQHDQYYKRWLDALDKVNGQLAEAQGSLGYMREGRGLP